MNTARSKISFICVHLCSSVERIRANLLGAHSGTGDRGKRRLLRAGLTGVATLGGRGVVFLSSILSLPLVSHYLGKERFGLWLTLIALINWYGLADLGVSNRVVNLLSTADGQDDHHRAQSIVSNAFIIAAGMVAILLAIFALIIPFVDWANVFNVSSTQARQEATAAFIIILLCFLLRILGSTVGSIYSAYQEGYLHQIWTALGSLSALLGLIIAVRMEAGLPALAASFCGGLMLGELLSAAYLFIIHRPDLRPSARFFHWADAKGILSTGFEYWIAQIATVMLFQTDLLIIARISGASAVSGYGVSLRLLSLIGAVQAAFTTPLWSAYSEALARRDIAWMRQTYRRSIVWSLVWSISAATMIALASGWLFRMLVTADIQPDARLLLPMILTEVMNSVARASAMFLNGVGAIRSQAVFAPITGVLNLILSWRLGSAWGPPGVAWATAISLGLYLFVVIQADVRKRIGSLETI
jgi:O-antigen/teichoic acid export membrane protein